MSDKIDSLDSELREAGKAIANLPRPPAPRGLVERTLARVAQITPLRRKPLMLRPITHALARFAAVALLVLMTQPLTYLDVVDSLGQRIENNIVGPRVVDHVEQVVDGVLTSLNAESFSQSEQYSNIHNANLKNMKRPVKKTGGNSRV